MIEKGKSVKSKSIPVLAGFLFFIASAGIILLEKKLHHSSHHHRHDEGLIHKHTTRVSVPARIAGEGGSIDIEERNAACPDHPTYKRMASWDEWQRQNCSSIVPWVASADDKEIATLPLFLIVGEQKCGTTFLRKLLHQHPILHGGTGLFGAEAGEVHFFDRAMKKYGIDAIPQAMVPAYSQYFSWSLDDEEGEREEEKENGHIQQKINRKNADGSPQQFGFDTTPSYLSHPFPIPWHISLILPHTNLIILVRDPVKRYASAINMFICSTISSQRNEEPFHVQGKMKSYLDHHDFESLPRHIRRGLYMYNIDRWLKHFSRDQMLVINSRQLFDSPLEVANQILDFVKLPHYQSNVNVTAALLDGQNKGDACSRPSFQWDEEDRQALLDFYQQPNQELETFLGQDLKWDKSTQ